MTKQSLVVRTACTLDCPDTCTLDVTVDNGVIVDIEAATSGDTNQLTDGFICRKVKHSLRRVYSPERLRTPLIRTGAKGENSFREATWDEALRVVADAIRSAIDSDGPDAVLPYVYNSSTGLLESSGAMVELFARLGCPDVEHSICAATYGAAWRQMYRGMESANPLHVADARLLVVWGANPNVSNTHLVPLVNEMVSRGGKLIVVDPRRIGVADRADLHLQIRPGTDAVLALAAIAELERRGAHDADFLSRHAVGVDEIMRVAREWSVERAAQRCGVDASLIHLFVDAIATTRPALLRPGYGIERNRNGGSGMLAVLALWAVAGNFGERGSGIIVSTSSTSSAALHDQFPVVSGARTTVNMNHVGRLLRGESSGRVRPRVLVVQGANPAVTAPDQQGFIRALDSSVVFTVVHDQVLTDTAAYADVVLPATSQFEVDDVAASYGAFVLQEVARAIEPVGESRSNTDLAFGLASLLGVELTSPRNIGVPALTEVRTHDEPIQFVTTFPAGGKIVLCDEGSELPLPNPPESDDVVAEALSLVTPATAKTVNSMFAEYDPPEVVVRVHPDDAASRGLVDGDAVTVSSGTARVDLECRVDERMRRGVCEIPKGLWRRHTANGWVGNALVPDHLNDLAGGACFNDGRVHITKR